jgi:hypothetical protein
MNDEPTQDRRRGNRASVIRSAKVICGPGQGIFDCLVLEQSQHGLQLDLGMVTDLPELVTVQFSGGASFLARRIWITGRRAGFELEGVQLLRAEAEERMKRYRHLLDTQGVLATVATMRAARFLEHSVLRQLAEEAEAAFLRLEMFLDSPSR